MKERMSVEEFREYRKSINNKYGLNRKESELLERVKVINGEKRTIQYGGRGLGFESIIESTNDYYYKNGIGMIRKIPTPVKVLSIGEKGMIDKAFYESKSALDFNGVLKGGFHIDFDTKETKNKTSFPLSNISDHQKEYLKDVLRYGGISFILVNFRVWEECYVLRYEDIMKYLDHNSSRKSIEYNYFKTALKENMVEKKVKSGGYIFDYLKTVEKLWCISL